MSSSWRLTSRLYGATAQLSVWITWRFIFIPALLCSLWMTNGGESTNRRWGVNAASLCERGYSQPPQVPPLPVWDDASMQIIHVDEFMLSITLTKSMHRPSPTHFRGRLSYWIYLLEIKNLHSSKSTAMFVTREWQKHSTAALQSLNNKYLSG